MPIIQVGGNITINLDDKTEWADFAPQLKDKTIFQALIQQLSNKTSHLFPGDYYVAFIVSDSEGFHITLCDNLKMSSLVNYFVFSVSHAELFGKFIPQKKENSPPESKLASEFKLFDKALIYDEKLNQLTKIKNRVTTKVKFSTAWDDKISFKEDKKVYQEFCYEIFKKLRYMQMNIIESNVFFDSENDIQMYSKTFTVNVVRESRPYCHVDINCEGDVKTLAFRHPKPKLKLKASDDSDSDSDCDDFEFVEKERKKREKNREINCSFFGKYHISSVDVSVKKINTPLIRFTQMKNG